MKLSLEEVKKKLKDRDFYCGGCDAGGDVGTTYDIISDLVEEVEELKTLENTYDHLEIMIEKCLKLIKENKIIKKEKNILIEALEDISKYPECTQGCCSCCHHLIEIHNILIKAFEKRS